MFPKTSPLRPPRLVLVGLFHGERLPFLNEYREKCNELINLLNPICSVECAIDNPDAPGALLGTLVGLAVMSAKFVMESQSV